MNLKHLKLPLIIFCSLTLLVALAPAVHAQSLLPACAAQGYCTLCDIMQVFINVGKFLLGIVGSLALLMFVYGGFVWLTSGGESGKIDAGKKILVNSVIGVAITFFAWAVVAFVVTALTSSNTNGFNWQAELKCAPLPGLPALVLEDRGTGTGSTTQGTKKEGDTCAKTNECDVSLYCNKSSPSQCATKLPTTNDTTKACVGMEVEGKDDLACQSGTCGNVIRVGLPEFAGLCQAGQCCKSNYVGANEPCDDSQEIGKTCQDTLYCKTKNPGDSTGTCQNKLESGKQCFVADVVGGKSNNICVSGNCDETYCIFTTSSIGSTGTGTALEGQICTSWQQCQNHCSTTTWSGIVTRNKLDCKQGQLFCYKWVSGTASDKVGKCSQALDIGQRCDAGAIAAKAVDGVAPCKTTGATCAGPIIGENYCQITQ